MKSSGDPDFTSGRGVTRTTAELPDMCGGVPRHMFGDRLRIWADCSCADCEVPHARLGGCNLAGGCFVCLQGNEERRGMEMGIGADRSFPCGEECSAGLSVVLPQDRLKLN